jgi:hypothetical protein
MSRPPLVDSLPHLVAVAAAHRARDQPEAALRALDATMGARHYTNQPDAYPVGGRKPVQPTLWTRRLVEQRQPYIGYTADDINLLHEARWYGEDDVPLGQVFAALAVPAFLLCSR